MRKLYLYLLLLLSASAAYTQINYEAGYFIDNSGSRTKCLIRNQAWKNNPAAFEYKLSANGGIAKKTIQEVSEFSVGDGYKFRRYTVNIERSHNDPERMDDQKEPLWSKEMLFLKLLVEGKATLYSYEDGNLIKYFYSTGNHETAEQLVYKEYKKENNVLANAKFRQQLYMLMGGEMEQFAKLKYQKAPLIKLFEQYNGTNGGKTINLSEKQNKGRTNIRITAGISCSSLTAINNNTNASFDLGSKLSYRIGTEAEYILPFNNNKWSLFTEPNLQQYKNTAALKNYEWQADYTYLEVPFGARHYMYLSNDSGIFIDAAYVLAFNLGSSYIKYNNASMDIERTSNFALGAGYNYKSYSAALRYSFKHGLLSNYVFWGTEYSSVSLTLGYRIF